jgi:hypothetical protein
MFYYSRDRAGEHPQAHLANYAGIFQADAYGGYNKLYEWIAIQARSWKPPARRRWNFDRRTSNPLRPAFYPADQRSGSQLRLSSLSSYPSVNSLAR